MREEVDDCTALLHRLSREFSLRDVASAAARDARIEARAEQVAYCLAALVRKARHARAGAFAEELRLERPDFEHQLTRWAATVAANLKRWGDDYEAVHDEFDRAETTTLKGLVRVRAADDVIDAHAVALAEIVAGGVRLREMALDALCDEPPASNAYLFTGSLGGWATRAIKNRRPLDARGLDDERDRPRDAGPDEELEDAEREGSLMVRDLKHAVARLAATRGLLDEAIEPIERLERVVSARGRPSGVDAAEFGGLRTYLLDLIDRLKRERLALTGMLAYVLLAMRKAAQLQSVAILSLRLAAIDRDAADAIAARMHAILDDEAQPTPMLVAKVCAADAEVVPRARGALLAELREAPRRRASMLAPVERRLRELPLVVADRVAIAAAVGASERTVTVQRSDTGTELSAVNGVYGSAFRRYALGRADER
jgi:hypothetical protein